MTISNSQGAIMASIWIASCEGLVGEVGGKLGGLGSTCLVVSNPI